jgi:Protein of unknown function (DUF2867)
VRIPEDQFRRTPWHVHRFLADVPLHDVWEIRLEGGGPGRHVTDFRAVVDRSFAHVAGSVRFLFGLRGALGKVLRLDEGAAAGPGPGSYVHRLSDEERRRSLEPPGTPWGIFRLVYAFEDEALGEILNRTVHAFSFMGMLPAPGGYRAHWAIYVRPVGGLTRPYMALIDPFRRWLIYPSVIRGIERTWRETWMRSPPPGR